MLNHSGGRPPTLIELKRRGDEVFAEAQQTMNEARQIVHESREMDVEMRQAMEEFER